MIKIIKGTIDRRVLINYRLDPMCLDKILPEPFKPRLFNGYALGGICLIRFKDMRPTWLPKFLGTSSENGTHRFCVEWVENGKPRTGIYIMKRFTNSRLHEFGGGKIFPGNLTFSKFLVDEGSGKYHISFESNENDYVDVLVTEATAKFPSNSVFSNIQEASQFFEKDDIGYSTMDNKKNHQGIKLVTSNWEVSPLNVLSVKSSLFTNEKIFPDSSAQIDHSLLMKNIKHDWQVVDDICCS